MKIAAAIALKDLAKLPVPKEVCEAYGVEGLEFGREYIIPKPLDARLITVVSDAVAKAAIESGVATLPYPKHYPLTSVDDVFKADYPTPVATQKAPARMSRGFCWGVGMRQGCQVFVRVLVAPMRPSAARAAHRDARPLPHLLQRGHVCEAMVVSLAGMTGFGGGH